MALAYWQHTVITTLLGKHGAGGNVDLHEVGALAARTCAVRVVFMGVYKWNNAMAFELEHCFCNDSRILWEVTTHAARSDTHTKVVFNFSAINCFFFRSLFTVAMSSPVLLADLLAADPTLNEQLIYNFASGAHSVGQYWWKVLNAFQKLGLPINLSVNERIAAVHANGPQRAAAMLDLLKTHGVAAKTLSEVCRSDAFQVYHISAADSVDKALAKYESIRSVQQSVHQVVNVYTTAAAPQAAAAPPPPQTDDDIGIKGPSLYEVLTTGGGAYFYTKVPNGTDIRHGAKYTETLVFCENEAKARRQCNDRTEADKKKYGGDLHAVPHKWIVGLFKVYYGAKDTVVEDSGMDLTAPPPAPPSSSVTPKGK